MTLTDSCQRLKSREEQFEKVREIIENDNKRNGTEPRRQTTSPPANLQAPTSTELQTTISRVPRPTSVVGNVQEDGRRNGQIFGGDVKSGGTPTSPTALSDRFARLRMAAGGIDTGNQLRRTDSRGSLKSPAQESPTRSIAGDSDGRSSFDLLSPVMSNSSTASRPAGPRAMNGGFGTHRPATSSIDAQVAAAMPQAPTPIYTPARNMQVTNGMDLPRSTARSIVGTGGRSNSGASVASSHAPGAEGEASYFGKVPSNGTGSNSVRRKSVYMPRETRIGAEKLYDYLKMHHILLIDCRTREEFDQGHIYAQSVICIDPTALRKDMSADQLQDSLVLSPEPEQDMFFNRDKFDLVVYYDRSTSSDQYLHHPRTEDDMTLKCLHDTLYEFNHDKPLQRPPILLMGGIEAWSDLVGSQALMMTSTASRAKNGRPISRVPVADGGSRLKMQKKRLRDYNPLDAEEELKWRERARKESVVVEQKQPLDEEDESAQVEDASPFVKNIEEFNRRFPEAASIGQQPIMHQPVRPSIPPKVPEYPAAPPPSQAPSLPTVPKRPAPAAPRMSYSGVHERSVSQTKSAELPAYVPPHLQPSNLRLPRTGLVNFGVTCYMNATIQALSSTLPLSLFFLDDKYRALVQRDNWKGSKGVLPDLFANLIRSVWKGDVEAIRPSTLRQFCARLNREWGIDRQQDAKEFYDFLVDCLHEDLNQNWQRTPLRALTEEQEMKREKMPKLVVSKKEWDRYLHREQSYLTSLFAGQHASRLRCTTCQFTSTTYEAFYSISVEIPRSGRSTIEDCLKSYCQEEMLSGDEVWKCPRCKKEREATKQITITRAPEFLVVHFKRFSAGRGESAKKVRTPIDFPLHDFDFEPYMLPTPTAAEAQAIARDYGAQELKTDLAMTAPYKYDAYAVMRHIGTTLTSGHYTCLARDRARRCWRHFNDTMIGDFEPERLPERDRLQNEMAYIVFYQRNGGK